MIAWDAESKHHRPSPRRPPHRFSDAALHTNGVEGSRKRSSYDARIGSAQRPGSADSFDDDTDCSIILVTAIMVISGSGPVIGVLCSGPFRLRGRNLRPPTGEREKTGQLR